MSEFNPTTPEKITATPFEDGTNLAFHESKLKSVEDARRLASAAFGAEITPVATAEAVPVSPKTHELIALFSKNILSMRIDELDADLLAENPYRTDYLNSGK